MRTRLANLWELLTTSFWFVPALMIVSATALSILTIYIDHLIHEKTLRAIGWVWQGGAEGARQMLAAIAGSIITVAGVVFSITIVSLTLASSQYGPRMLRQFMHDSGNQFAMGTFLSTFVYCLLVLRTVRSLDRYSFVPYISITVGLALAFISVFVFVYFIHHISTSMRAESLTSAIASELMLAVERVFPEELGSGAGSLCGPAPELALMALPSVAVRSAKDGYIQAIENETLMDLTRNEDLLVQLLVKPGAFVTRGGIVARIWGRKKLPRHDLAARFAKAFIFGIERTPTQDTGYPIRQLVEIAVRSLSPGINDPFTAMNCVDWLGAGLLRVARRGAPRTVRLDDSGTTRVIAPTTTFGELMEESFTEIARHAANSPMVLRRVLEALVYIVPGVHRLEDIEVVSRQAEFIFELARRVISETDLAMIEREKRRLLAELSDRTAVLAAAGSAAGAEGG